MKAQPFNWDNQDLTLSLYIQPNASKDKVMGLFNHQIKIQISAPAVDNKANQYLQKWLAKEFKAKKSDVVLLSGEHARQKKFKITGVKKIPDWLEELDEDKILSSIAKIRDTQNTKK